MTAELSGDAATGTALILAAGAGTRMKSQVPKVLHPVLGKPLLGHVLDTVGDSGIANVVVVVGHGREAVMDYVAGAYPSAHVAIQDQQLGTGHAVSCGLEAAMKAGMNVSTLAVVAGDTPLLPSATLAGLATSIGPDTPVAVLTAEVADPAGYGRVVRAQDGTVEAIVEQRDASPEQLQIREINSGMYAFDGTWLHGVLGKLKTNNSQGEYYLTDVVGLARQQSLRAVARLADTADDVHGINDRIQLAEAARLMQLRINHRWMTAGVTLIDPETVWIETGVELCSDVTIDRNTSVAGSTRVGSGAVIGPDTTLIDCIVGEGATVVKSHCVAATIGDRADVGPYTYLRPGTELHPRSKVGAYVEIKNSTIGESSKVPHLSYVGDATIGRGTNIGASTVFVNYDGESKHRSVVGDHARVGSDSMIVAPVTIGDGAYTAAGSVITEDVPPGALGVGRAHQHTVPGWVARKRPGTDSARAAEGLAE